MRDNSLSRSRWPAIAVGLAGVGFFLTTGASPHPAVEGTTEPRWSVHALLLADDELPHTRGPRQVGAYSIPRRLRLKHVVADAGELVFATDHGVFVATRDSIIQLVTELDSIPETGDLFRDFGDATIDRKPFVMLGRRRVGFGYLNRGQLSFYTASPSGIERTFTVPTAVRVSEREIQVSRNSHLANILAWTYEDEPPRPKLHFLWDLGRPGAILFSFDGERVDKRLAEGDTLPGADGGVVSLLARHPGIPVAVRQPGGAYRMVSRGACVDRIEFDWSSNSVLLPVIVAADGGPAVAKLLRISDGTSATPVIFQGQGIDNVPYGSIASIGGCFDNPNEYEWIATDGAVVLYGSYCVYGDRCYSGFFRASPGGLVRVAAWRAGDTLASGTVQGFGRRSRGGELRSGWLIDPQGDAVLSFVRITDSHDGIEEGVFLARGGTVAKVLVQGDSAPTDVRGLFRRFRPLFRGSRSLSGDLEFMFEADLEHSRADWGLFRFSGGRASTVLARGDTVRERPRRDGRRLLLVNQLYGAEFSSGHAVVLEAELRKRAYRGAFSTDEGTVLGYVVAVREGP